MTSRLISEIKLGKLVETLRLLQAQGMNDFDFANLEEDHYLIREVFRIVRDKFIFKNKTYAEGYEKNEQVGKFKKWNEEFDLGITEKEFNSIPNFPVPPQSNINQLFCACLIYEFDDPLTTLANGIKILDYTLMEKQGKLEVEFAPHNRVPDKLDDKEIRFRPGASVRKKGFRWIIVELGRELAVNYLFAKNETIREAIKKRDKQGLVNVGQELPYIAAMYPDWITSVMSGKSYYLYPAPLALDIQLSRIWKFSREAEILAIVEDKNSQFPAFGKKTKFRIYMESLAPEANASLYDGYGICTIVQEIYP